MLMIGLSGLAICMLVLVFLGLLINIFKVFLDMKSRDKISKVVLKLFDNHIKIKVFSMILGFFLVILGGTLKNVGIILLGASIMGITIMMIAAPDWYYKKEIKKINIFEYGRHCTAFLVY